MPQGVAQFAVVERTDFGYANGARTETGTVHGAAVEVAGGEPLRGDTGAASHFCDRAVILPTASNAVAVESKPHAGAIELVLKLRGPLGSILGADDLEETDILVYCGSDDAAVVSTFRGLACAEWDVIGGPTFLPRIGLCGPISERLAVKDGAGRILRRVQPPFRDRFLRLPASALAASKTNEVLMQVRVGPGAARLATTLGTSLRLNCLPVWNGRIASTESPPAASDGTVIVDTQGSCVRNLLVIECYNRETGTCWHDSRFAGRDRSALFDVAVAEGSSPRLRFHGAVPLPLIRLKYLAWLEPLAGAVGDVLYDAQNRPFVVKSAPVDAYTADQILFDDHPRGLAETHEDLIALTWRLAPPELLRAIGVGPSGRDAFARIEPGWAYSGSGLSRVAVPATRIVLQRGKASPNEWSTRLNALARQLEQYRPLGSHLVVEFEGLMTTAAR